MKIKVVATVAIAGVLIAGVLLSVACTINFQPSVEITNFFPTGSLAGSSDNFVNVWFTLNLNNTGAGEAKDLTITFRANTTTENSQQFIYTNSTPPYDPIAEFDMGEPCLLGDLTAGETKDYTFYWVVSVDSDASLLTADLKSSGVTLDQATMTIPSIAPIPKVKITTFTYLGQWHGTRLGGMLDLFSLSYTNIGNTDVKSEHYLTITLTATRTDPQHPTYTPNPDYNPYEYLDEMINGKLYYLGNLKAGETKNFEKSYPDVGFLLVEPFALTATLRSNGTILDQATLMIPLHYLANLPPIS